MTPRRVLHYTDSREVGGAEQSMFTVIAGLEGPRWRSQLLAEDAAVAAEAAARGVPVRQAAPMPLGLEGARRVPALVRLLRRESPDVFHAHLSWPVAAKWPLAAAVLARVPAVVASVQLVPPVVPERSTRLQLGLLARGVDRYLAVSRDIRRTLVDDWGWPAGRVVVVHNAARAVDAAPGDLPGTRPVVLTAARLDVQKGHRVLLEAAAALPGVTFALAGDGPERGALEARARELGVADRVRFLGHRGDVPALLAACDVFALPSLYEGSSLAVLEAMAAGRAVVTSAIGGTDELVEDGVSGLLVPPGDAAALADRLRRVLDDARLRDALGAAARQRVQAHFTADQLVQRVSEVYAGLLGPS